VRPDLEPPPRAVPWTLAARVLLGGYLVMTAWLVITISGSTAAIFVGNSTLLTSWRFAGDLIGGSAEVLANEPTSSRSNGRQIHRITFGYEAEGRAFEAASYCDAPGPAVGAEVAFEAPADSPALARISGMRERPFPAWAAFPALFPLVGFGLLAFGVAANARRLALLRRGHSAWGLLTEKRPTRTQVNGRPVYRLTFRFLDRHGSERTAEARSHDAEHFDEQVARHVLYDDAGRSCVAEVLPGAPEVEDGRWRPAPPGAVARVLALPALAAAGFAALSAVTL